MTWRNMSSAPKDGTPILAICKHGNTSEDNGVSLTPYGFYAEANCHVKDGPNVIVFCKAFDCGSYEEPLTCPAGWFLNDYYLETPANPVMWQPIEDF